MDVPETKTVRSRTPVLPEVPPAWLKALVACNQEAALLPLAEGVASFAADPASDPGFARGAYLLALLVLTGQGLGHTCLPLDGPEGLDDLAGVFGEDPAQVRALVEDPRLDAILDREGGRRRPLVLDRGALYVHRLHRAERGFAERVLARAGLPDGPEPEIPEAILREPMDLTEEQRQAVRAGLRRKLSLITGGPGTGKTSIVLAILQAALAAGTPPEAIRLAAPTGKAANRMAKDLGRVALSPGLPMPRTLHGLLDYVPSQERYRHHAGNPLSADLVIVDEASMIDLVLMDRLLQAVKPEARLILLGDKDQLPSVDPGCVFKDLVVSLPRIRSLLTRSLRMKLADAAGRAILLASRKVNRPVQTDRPMEEPEEGLFEGEAAIRIREGGEPFQGSMVELADLDMAAMAAFLDRWLPVQVEGLDGFHDKIRHVFTCLDGTWDPGDLPRLKELFDYQNQARILCALKHAPDLRGVHEINAHLHGKVQARGDGKLRKDLDFSLGEPVLMTRNDYRRGIFNGDQGLMLLVAREGGGHTLDVVFPVLGSYKAFAAGPLLKHLELAYALSVHKAQGAEYRTVALVLPTRPNRLLTRELVYTAMTRATHSVQIIARPELFRAAADASLVRHSGLAARLSPIQWAP
jgi:exodeoxyribonuclease V alpha subunit